MHGGRGEGLMTEVIKKVDCGYWRNAADFEFRFVIHGIPAVLKNRRKIITLGHRCPACKRGRQLSSVPSDAARRWMTDAITQLRAQWPFREPIPIGVDVHAQIVTFASDHRKRDLSNSYGCPEDTLQPNKKHGWVGIIADDSQIKSHDGSRILYDKDLPRVEITLKQCIF